MQDGKCTPHVCLENFSRSETISAEFVPEIKTYELKKKMVLRTSGIPLEDNGKTPEYL